MRKFSVLHEICVKSNLKYELCTLYYKKSIHIYVDPHPHQFYMYQAEMSTPHSPSVGWLVKVRLSACNFWKKVVLATRPETTRPLTSCSLL